MILILDILYICKSNVMPIKNLYMIVVVFRENTLLANEDAGEACGFQSQHLQRKMSQERKHEEHYNLNNVKEENHDDIGRNHISTTHPNDVMHYIEKPDVSVLVSSEANNVQEYSASSTAVIILNENQTVIRSAAVGLCWSRVTWEEITYDWHMQ